ncbi:MAG: GPW/gp25 family protein [Lachnospiraceae bacterium]|nr:GPW/gp25 family protein [Lachnospiraceae bacterium]
MPEESFLGRGMKFPPQINKATGRFITSEDAVSVKESVYLILMTQKTERWLRPEFGSNLSSYTFMDTNETMLNLMGTQITRDIINGEPRISDVQIDIDPDMKKGCLIVHIDYTIAQTNTRDNLVFPFYLNVTTEGDEDEGNQGL